MYQAHLGAHTKIRNMYTSCIVLWQKYQHFRAVIRSCTLKKRHSVHRTFCSCSSPKMAHFISHSSERTKFLSSEERLRRLVIAPGHWGAPVCSSVDPGSTDSSAWCAMNFGRTVVGNEQLPYKSEPRQEQLPYDVPSYAHQQKNEKEGENKRHYG